MNELIAEDDYFKVIVISVKHKDEFGINTEGEGRVNLYLENKTDQDILFEMEGVVVDGVEVDDYDFKSYYKPTCHS